MSKAVNAAVTVPLLFSVLAAPAAAARDWEGLSEVFLETAWLRRDTRIAAVSAMTISAMGDVAEQLRDTIVAVDTAVARVQEDFEDLQNRNIAWLRDLATVAENHKPDVVAVLDAETYQTELRHVYDFQSAVPVEDMLHLEHQFLIDVAHAVALCNASRHYLITLAQSRGVAATAEHIDISPEIDAMGRIDEELAMQAFWLKQMQDTAYQQRTKRQATAETIASVWTYLLRAALGESNVGSVNDVIASVDAAARGDETRLFVSQLAWAASNRGTTLLRSYHSPVLARRAVLADTQRFRDIKANLEAFPIDSESRQLIGDTVEVTIERLNRAHGEIYVACQYRMERYVETRRKVTQQLLDTGMGSRCQALADAVLSESTLSVQEEAFAVLKDTCP